MQKFMIYFIIALLTFGFSIQDVAAKRFSGGRSFGAQRTKTNVFNHNKAKTTKATPTQKKNSKWGHLLGGMLIGGLLTSLFMGHGFATGIITWLVLGAVLLFLITLFRKKYSATYTNVHSTNRF